jgi:hypothetical protein
MKKQTAILFSIIALILGGFIGYTITSNTKAKFIISLEEVQIAQDTWKNGVINLGKMKIEGKTQSDLTKAADEFVTKTYNYSNEDVEFKPTKASQNEFRFTQEDAVSYFVTGNIKEDKGFATIDPYKDIKFDNAKIVQKENIATAMGNYYFTNMRDETTKVNYTFQYLKNPDNNIKIIIHHSSLPYVDHSHE